MIMVIGGSFQGKESFANAELKLQDTLIDGADCSYDAIFTCKGIKNFHLFVKRFLSEEKLTSLVDHLVKTNPEIVIISDEIGYGIVPIDKIERKWREQTGRICCQLMQHTSTCYRVTAGIGRKIKG